MIDVNLNQMSQLDLNERHMSALKGGYGPCGCVCTGCLCSGGDSSQVNNDGGGGSNEAHNTWIINRSID